ncbi:MAG: hypothetical protein GX409_08710, partial [candidate division Zixibacteria bacterium]|nr:hypothetical protein [candidate division Zixibacteria bacterium]
MNKFLLAVVSLTVLLICGLSLAQDIYVYPNKKLADPACGGLIEYRRYTLEEARSYQQGGSFEPYLTTAWSSEQRLTTDSNVYSPKAITYGDSIFCSYFSFIEYLPYYISSYNQGIDWNRRICLADTSYTFSYSNPELAKYGSNILMVSSIYNFQSQGFNLAYRKSVDNGLTWASLHSILPYYRLHQSEYSSMGFSGRTIFSSY